MKNILITGYEGFIGKNLKIKLKTKNWINLFLFGKNNNLEQLKEYINSIDIIIHLAGENRSDNENDFYLNNTKFTKTLCDFVEEKYLKEKKKTTIIYSSSIKVDENSFYGNTKLQCENCLKNLSKKRNIDIFIYRLTNVFGKWSKPNYNSAIATFCHNISRGIEITIDNPENSINLLYIDDLIKSFIKTIKSLNKYKGINYVQVDPVYKVKLKEIVKKIYAFNETREKNYVLNVGKGFDRKLYATYLSFLPQNNFKKEINQHSDSRGTFSELIKTSSSGQFSFFTALPGVTRGSHYHNTKSEKFVVVKGEAEFRLKCLLSGKEYVTNLSEKKLEMIDSIPGWIHEIKNTGASKLIVFVWANEVFDQNQPDTYREI
ncbi:NAD-dependent epimerase/dehydratase family protein [Prochlorococcus marinus]|uniref:polysaccharide biosynthesis C-terminal domain-containing protein n=1 Tax=Prochlorococcus marinus TaxID=1219 RepID=UPI00019005D8|nr:NAD-dependent epimerase/dehydratase family protein [Prochlorococcus marinus]EEE40234.1 nucleoside-diphosphate-sugar epimerase WbjC [Prochlorococcus marinus str. MIT 9202]